MKKKALSFLMALILTLSVCSALPFAVLADELVPSADSGYTVFRSAGFLYGVKGNTTVSSFKSAFSQAVSVVSATGTALFSSAYVTTGSKVQLKDGANVIDTLTVVVSGDVNSDGKVNATDCAVLKSYFKQTATLSTANYHAADADSDGTLSVTDYVMIKRQIANTYVIDKVSPDYKVTVTLPDVTGYTAANARLEIEAAGFNYASAEAYSDTVYEGYVISQTPEAGEYTPGTLVTVIISKGKDPANVTKLNYVNNMKAIWLSQFDLSETWATSSATSFRAKMKSILQKCQQSGFNTVFLQVRPNGDSIYPSELYPWSKYVFSYGTGYSQTATKSYDPLAITVEEAHKLNLSIHAWFNPMRLMSPSEISGVNNKYLLKQWYNNRYGTYVVECGSYLYLNPAYPEVREYIIDGIEEVCRKYDVDGVHFDDYFYPTTDAYFDQAAFNASGFSDVFNFRRYCMNLLISGVYSAVKAINSDLVYGISPAGEPNRVKNNHCADVYKWCSSAGYIDYIMPQIYFGFNHPSAPFKTMVTTWANMCTSSTVKLYIGLALYKAADPDSRTSYDGTEWGNTTTMIQRQIQHCDTVAKCKGVAIFSYTYMLSSEFPTGATETTNMISALKSFAG